MYQTPLYYVNTFFIHAFERLINIILLYINMEIILPATPNPTQPAPKKRGRPSSSYEIVNGEQYITAEILEKEVEKLEKHRKQCRDRYRNRTKLLKALRPDLFESKRNGNCTRNGQIIQKWGIPLHSAILHSTETETNPSEIQGRTGVREVSILEASLSPTSQISR